jgi:hypothetical protein
MQEEDFLDEMSNWIRTISSDDRSAKTTRQERPVSKWHGFVKSAIMKTQI